MSTLPGLLVALALILANAFFVAAEFALVAVDRTRLGLEAEAGSRAARAGQRLLTKLSFNLSGAQLGITITSLALGLLAQPVVAELLEPAVAGVVGEASALAVSVVVALFATTVVQMVVGELVPKSVAVAKPLETTLGLAGAFRVYALVFKPVIAVCNTSANALLRMVGVEPTEELSEVRSREELRRLVRTSEEGGTIRGPAAELLERTFRFSTKTAADALTPRVEVQALAIDSDVGDLLDLSACTGNSRFPVHGGDLDTLLGVVHVKEVMGLPRDARRSTPLSTLVRPVEMVPETKPLDELLDDLQGAAAHLAVVLDEYGGTAGIITVEDLVEEIVGPIVDEHDIDGHVAPSRPWQGAHLLSGRLHPDEVRDACGFEVPEGAYETLAGFVLDRLGRIPEAGDTFVHDGWRIAVAEMDAHRVAMVRMVAPPPGAVSDETAVP